MVKPFLTNYIPFLQHENTHSCHFTGKQAMLHDSIWCSMVSHPGGKHECTCRLPFQFLQWFLTIRERVQKQWFLQNHIKWTESILYLPVISGRTCPDGRLPVWIVMCLQFVSECIQPFEYHTRKYVGDGVSCSWDLFYIIFFWEESYVLERKITTIIA